MNLTKVLELASNSDVGRRRGHNEDTSAIEAQHGLLIVADGMGGYAAGEVASAVAISTIVKHIQRRLPNVESLEPDQENEFSHESLVAKAAIREANYEVFRSAQDYSQFEGMGTTVVVLLLYDNRFTVAHVGDSRLYRLRDEKLEKITNDHSLIQELIDRGLYTKEEAEAKTPRNLVTRALGINESVNVDISEGSVLPDDLFLLCTDGLTDMVSDDEILLILNKYGDNLNLTAQKLIDLANKRGGKDNITAVLGRPTIPFPSSNSWYNKIFGTS
ncbi:MAG: Stp1/IreP family PP2C-type Ser/Thr phosphatase [Gammaproteobacteria bacterium]